MPLVNTKEMFKKAYEGKYAVGCFNVDSIAMVQAVLEAAQKENSPVIISISKGSREFMHPGNIKDLIEIVAKDITIPYAIHLDHGKSFELCKDVIDEGFTSVMIDVGQYSYEEGIEITKKVVEYAHKKGVSVEGELGGLDAENKYDGEHSFTDPHKAKEFIEKTGIDSLAVSVGTGHGTKKFKEGETPNLKWDVLNKIKELCPGFPLVLHGSSSIPKNILEIFNNYGGNIEKPIGIPEELLTKACSINVCKINIGTDFRVAYTGGLRKSLTEIKNRYEPRNFLVPAKKSAQDLVEYKMSKVFMSSGHAND